MDTMDNIVLGAYATEQDAIDSLSQRTEPQDELIIQQDDDFEHPWRIHWLRK